MTVSHVSQGTHNSVTGKTAFSAKPCFLWLFIKKTMTARISYSLHYNVHETIIREEEK
jgi:hypothetical protein